MSWIFILSLFGQTIYGLDTVVVTATRYPSRLKDIAQAVLVLERSDIEARKPASLAEALRDQAGIDIRDYGVSGSFAGINMRGVPSTAVIVLVDGQPINSILNGAADLSSVDIDEVERIEIIRGPASSLYGANALGGVVNVITRHRYEKFAYRGKTDVACAVRSKIYSTNNFFLDTGGPFGDMNYGLGGGLTYADGFRSNSRMAGYHVKSSVGYFQVPFEISAEAKYNQKDYGVPGPKPLIDSLHFMPVFGDSTANSLRDHEKDRNFSGRFGLNCDGPGLRWQNTLSGSGSIIDYHTVYPGFIDTITEDYSWQTMTMALNSSVVLNAQNTDLIAGIDVRYDSLIAGKISVKTGDTTWRASQSNIGAWLEVKNSFDRIVLNSSLRLDRNSGYGYFLSPQIGIVYTPIPDLRLKSSFGRAFRAPGFNDLYFPQSGNLNLKPEIGNGAEVRLECGNGSKTFTALSFFIRDITNRIAWLPTQGGLWQPQNVNHLTIRGVEWETRYAFQDKISVENQITYLNGRQTNRELINADGTARDEVRSAAFTPPLAISSRWDIKLPAGLILNLAGFYSSARKNYYENWNNYPSITIDTKTLDAYVIFNAGLTRTWFNHLSVAAGCKNLLDVNYATQFGNTIDDLDYPMPPRTFYFQMSLE